MKPNWFMYQTVYPHIAQIAIPSDGFIGVSDEITAL